MSSNPELKQRDYDPASAVIAVTETDFIRFESFQECLQCSYVDPGSIIYTGVHNFNQACSIKRLELLCERLGQEVPDIVYRANIEGSCVVWDFILDASVTPADINARKPLIQPTEKKKASNRAPNDDSSGQKTGAKVKYPDHFIISVNVTENPKKADAARRFGLYKTGMTVGEYIAAGGLRTDINWDSNPKNKWISVNPPTA